MHFYNNKINLTAKFSGHPSSVCGYRSAVCGLHWSWKETRCSASLRLGFFAIILLAVSTASAQSYSTKNLKSHITYLASDKLQGRGTGTKGEKMAAKYITKQFRKIGLTPKGTDGYLQSYTFKPSANPHATTEDANVQPVNGTNVIGYLDNGAANTIIVGAHFDHLGLGYDKNSLDPNPEGKIHNGADDNASGVAGVIELARHYHDNDVKEPYNFLFICFSGEELGLYGSKKFCEHPTMDLSKTHLMVNLDMIGRLKEDKTLMVGGVGTAPGLEKLIEDARGNLKVNRDSSGIGPSDHTSFYLKDIPVLFFFTGQHSDYHKPSDDAGKINYAGEAEVLGFIQRSIDAAVEKPKFTFTATKNKTANNPSFKVTLGIMPDYVFDGTGLRIDGVTDDRPAARAGLKAGDVIVQMGDLPIADIQDYMKALGKFSKGEKTMVKIKRGSEEKSVEVEF